MDGFSWFIAHMTCYIQGVYRCHRPYMFDKNRKVLYLILYKINKNIQCLVFMVEIHINAFI